MPEHRIEISQPPRTVLHSDVTLTVYSDDRLLGELSISKGSIDWRPANRRIRRYEWERFARLMEDG